MKLYKKALATDPQDFETNFNMGILFYEMKDVQKAVHHLKNAINEEKSPTAMFNLAVIYEEQGERQLAKEMYQETLNYNPDHFKARVNIAIILEKEGQSKEAHNLYEGALKSRPKEARIHHNMGINMKRAGKLEDALSYYKNAMNLEPDNSVFQYNTGVLYNLKSDYNESIKLLEQSIENNKENVYAYLALGDAFEKNKELTKAISTYRELMSLNINVQGLQEKIAFLDNQIK